MDSDGLFDILSVSRDIEVQRCSWTIFVLIHPDRHMMPPWAFVGESASHHLWILCVCFSCGCVMKMIDFHEIFDVWKWCHNDFRWSPRCVLEHQGCPGSVPGCIWDEYEMSENFRFFGRKCHVLDTKVVPLKRFSDETWNPWYRTNV